MPAPIARTSSALTPYSPGCTTTTTTGPTGPSTGGAQCSYSTTSPAHTSSQTTSPAASSWPRILLALAASISITAAVNRGTGTPTNRRCRQRREVLQVSDATVRDAGERSSMPAFRSVVSVLVRALGDFSLYHQGRPAGGRRPPSAGRPLAGQTQAAEASRCHGERPTDAIPRT